MEFCVKVLPECPSLNLVLANVYFEMRLWDKAEAAYAKTLALDPSNVTAANNLGLAYSLQGKNAQARAAFENVLRIHPSHPDAKKALESLPKS